MRGKTGEPYPQYCESCEKELGDLDDRQIACKTDNCTGTWTWSKAAQLAAGVRPEPKEPEAQLEPEIAAAPSGDGPAPLEANAPEAGLAADASAADAGQPPTPPEASAVTAAPPTGKRRRNKNKRRREIRPPERRCQTCLEFLGDRKTIEIACQGCKTPIYWPPESQLQTHLGAWSAPSLCGACKRDLTEAQRIAQREALRHPQAVEAPGRRGRGARRRGSARGRRRAARARDARVVVAAAGATRGPCTAR